MERDSLLQVYRYNAYANGVVLETVARLSPEQLNSPSPSRESIFRLLLHMLNVEGHFVKRSRGEPFYGLRPETVPALREAWERVAAEAEQYLSNAQDSDMSHPVVVYERFPEFQLPIWQLLFQAYNHSQVHRGELSILLTHLGHPLALNDAVVFFAQASGQTFPWSD